VNTPCFRLMPLLLLSIACDPGRSGRDPGGPPRQNQQAADSGIARGDAGSSDRNVSETSDTGVSEERDGAMTLEDASGGPADQGMTGAADAGAPDSGFGPYCRSVCSSSNDCVSSPSSAISDADNYACNANGRCDYLGCNNTNECVTVFMSSDYGCIHFPGYAAPACVKTCSSAIDCEQPSPLFGSDNYRCNNGGCEWLGCNTTAECTEVYRDERYICDSFPGVPNKTCYLPCSSRNDCGTPTSPAYDADNYDCVSSQCVYRGCNNANECQTSFPSLTWVCE
jgi:hypothetical protein